VSFAAFSVRVLVRAPDQGNPDRRVRSFPFPYIPAFLPAFYGPSFRVLVGPPPESEVFAGHVPPFFLSSALAPSGTPRAELRRAVFRPFKDLGSLFPASTDQFSPPNHAGRSRAPSQTKASWSRALSRRRQFFLPPTFLALPPGLFFHAATTPIPMDTTDTSALRHDDPPLFFPLPPLCFSTFETGIQPGFRSIQPLNTRAACLPFLCDCFPRSFKKRPSFNQLSPQLHLLRFSDPSNLEPGGSSY